MSETLPAGKKASDFDGEIMDIPPTVDALLRDANGERIYKCPHCRCMATLDECDSLGAEDDCVFCRQCNREFEPNY